MCLPAHHGRGVAKMVKLASLRYLKEHSYAEARTHNDTANPAILALNEKSRLSPAAGVAGVGESAIARTVVKLDAEGQAVHGRFREAEQRVRDAAWKRQKPKGN